MMPQSCKLVVFAQVSLKKRRVTKFAHMINRHVTKFNHTKNRHTFIKQKTRMTVFFEVLTSSPQPYQRRANTVRALFVPEKTKKSKF